MRCVRGGSRLVRGGAGIGLSTLANVIGVRAAGGSKRAMLGAAIGLIGGLLLGGPIGAALGLLVGRVAEFAVAVGLAASFVLCVVMR